MNKKRIPARPGNQSEPLTPTYEPEEPLAPPDGKWHAVERRGVWFTERTYDDGEDIPSYQQVGFIARGLFGPKYADSSVQAWPYERLAVAIAKMLNGDLSRREVELLVDFADWDGDDAE